MKLKYIGNWLAAFLSSVICHDMIFIYCNWVSTRWQWSVNMYKNRKETDVYERRNNTQNNTKAQNTQNTKQIHETRKQTYNTCLT
jgi:hypothetical protein